MPPSRARGSHASRRVSWALALVSRRERRPRAGVPWCARPQSIIAQTGGRYTGRGAAFAYT